MKLDNLTRARRQSTNIWWPWPEMWASGPRARRRASTPALCSFQPRARALRSSSYRSEKNICALLEWNNMNVREFGGVDIQKRQSSAAEPRRRCRSLLFAGGRALDVTRAAPGRVHASSARPRLGSRRASRRFVRPPKNSSPSAYSAAQDLCGTGPAPRSSSRRWHTRRPVAGRCCCLAGRPAKTWRASSPRAQSQSGCCPSRESPRPQSIPARCVDPAFAVAKGWVEDIVWPASAGWVCGVVSRCCSRRRL